MTLSPMMKQYLDIKNNYPDTLLFFRLGDFYEMFFDDAVKASKALELTLTGRDCGLSERAPMCGVPYHAAEGYIAKLVAEGFKVAVCEQITEPTAGKGIVEREVTRIITAGTVIEDTLLKSDKNNYLLCVCYSENEIGAAWADISTGEFNCAKLDSLTELNELLSRISPAEIIANEEMLVKSAGLTLVKYGAVSSFTLYGEEKFAYDFALSSLRRNIKSPAIDSITANKICVMAAGAIFDYIYTTQKRDLSHITAQNADPVKRLIIGGDVRRTLELFENTADGNKKGSLLWVLDKTKTSMGSRKMRKWIESPLSDMQEINCRLDAVEELTKSSDKLICDILDLLSGIKDIERICGRLSCGGMSPKDCYALGASLAQIKPLKDLMRFNSPLISRLKADISDFTQISHKILSAISSRPPARANGGDLICDGYDEKLDELRGFKRNFQQLLASMEMQEKEETGIKNLKIGYNKVFGYYIEIPKSQTALVPYRFVRKQTVLSAERYITDELKELESKIAGSDENALSRELELYSFLLDEIKELVDKILSAADAIAVFDCLLSFARVSKDNKYVRPDINDGDVIEIVEGRHPVVELMIDEQFVPNNTSLSEDSNIMLITGPNMAGKSVYMRQVAIITIMAHAGCFVSADKADICITDKIFTRVGASDDLNRGRSTFMVEMNEVSSIIDSAGEKSLVLLDEVGRGTSTYDGLSIAWSILEYMSQRVRAKILFSTHYHELTELESKISGLKNYKMTVREVGDNIFFIRKLMRGSANKSFGIEVASLAGLPEEIISRAKELLKQLESANITKQSKLAAAAAAQQLTLFDKPINSEIYSIISETDLDMITPRHAMDILSDLKEKIANMNKIG